MVQDTSSDSGYADFKSRPLYLDSWLGASHPVRRSELGLGERSMRSSLEFGNIIMIQ